MRFEDEPFDLDGLPAPPQRVVKAKKATPKSGISWTRYKAQKPIHCDSCLAEIHKQWPQGTHAPNLAVYKRVTASGALYLCALHGTEMKAADERTASRRKKGGS